MIVDSSRKTGPDHAATIAPSYMIRNGQTLAVGDHEADRKIELRQQPPKERGKDHQKGENHRLANLTKHLVPFTGKDNAKRAKDVGSGTHHRAVFTNKENAKLERSASSCTRTRQLRLMPGEILQPTPCRTTRKQRKRGLKRPPGRTLPNKKRKRKQKQDQGTLQSSCSWLLS